MTLGEIAKLVNGRLRGPDNLEISGPCAADSAEAGGIAFAETADYLAVAENSAASALLLPLGLESTHKPYVQVGNPREAFLKLLQQASRPLPLNSGVHPTAVVDPSADIDPTAQVGPYAIVEAGASVGPRCRIYAHVYVGEQCVLQEGCVIYPHAVLYRRVSLGNGTIVHAGAVLGADGFGYAWDGSHRIKVPQVGSVEIGSDCEIGAIAAVDRATVGTTSIGNGTKIDNLVQIAHNVQIGEDCAIASLVGLGGSATLGDRVAMGGQAGVADHIDVASDALLAARSSVMQDIKGPGEYFGTPARPAGEGRRAAMLALRLPDLFSRLRKLEKKVGDQ